MAGLDGAVNTSRLCHYGAQKAQNLILVTAGFETHDIFRQALILFAQVVCQVRGLVGNLLHPLAQQGK